MLTLTKIPKYTAMATMSLVLLVSFFVSDKHAIAQSPDYTYQWVQTLFGTGNTSLVTINYNYLSVSGGANGHLAKIGDMSNISGSLTQVLSQSGSVFPLYVLEANKNYILVRTTTSNFSTALSTSLSQIINGDNTSTAYPYTSGGFYGFVFFKTDASRNIYCYDVDLLGTGADYNFEDCENAITVPSSGTSTVVNVDVSALSSQIASSSEKQAASLAVLAFAIMFVGVFMILLNFKK